MPGTERETAVANLKAITYRLSSTPSKQLPQIAPPVASQLWSCKDLLSTTPDSNKQNNDASVLVHRFKTHLSTLLQDRTVEVRWAAVVLVKAAIEAGGVEVLSKSSAWVRNLLAILKKPDPSSTRCLAVIALTRIFTLTWDHSNLTREITTPALPAFIASCLGNAGSQRCGATELQTILEAFAALVPRHPTIFRTNEAQIKALLAKIISGTTCGNLSSHYSESHRKTSQRLLVLLHHCSPKQGAAGKWDETLQNTVKAAHATSDRILRSLVEDWHSTSEVQSSVPHTILYQGGLEGDGEESLGLGRWQGMYAGSERLNVLIGLLGSHVQNATSGTISLRLGLISDLLARLLSVRTPAGKHQGSQANNQIAKDERDTLFSVLPLVHASALRLLHSLLRRFGLAALPILQPILSQVTWVFESEVSNDILRPSVYRTLALILEMQGPHMSKDDITDIEPILRACCKDLLPKDDGNATPSSQINGISSKSTGVANGIIGQQTTTHPSHTAKVDGLEQSAQALLPICLSVLNPAQMPGKLRNLLERSAVLTQNKDALLAAVLYPAQDKKKSSAKASLLPLLARQFPSAPEVETLLRPRMPIIRTGEGADGDVQLDDQYDDDVFDTAIHGAYEDEGPINGVSKFSSDNKLFTGSVNASAVQPRTGTHQVEQNAGEGFMVSKISEKRVAEGTTDDRSAKRARASVLDELPESQSIVSLDVVEKNAARTGNPAEQAQSSFVTALEPSQQAAAPIVAPASTTVAREAEDDDSDFEMPPLTMEQDTDPEDEEQD